MAFMGRGGFPSIGNHYHRHYWHHTRYYYYVPLDNTYVIMQMIVAFIILIVGIVSFIIGYQSTIVDPIENTKKLFINTHLIIIGILLAVTLIINFFSKNQAVLIKRLVIIFAISIIMMLTFLGIRLNLDATYTKERFEQFYTEQNISESSKTKSKIDIGITGMSLKTEKEYYIDECMKLYNIFQAKTYGTLGIHLLLNLLLIYQIVRVSNIQGKKDKLNKDDLILFDEEQNIKY